MANYTNYWDSARTALKKKKKSTDYRGLNTKYSYSSFWMDDKWDNTDKFSGMSVERVGSADTVKLIKLTNYRRAITNFVKIVTKQDIPVMWAGSDSFTNGKAINLSTDIKDTNFDVTVGLALHEASHIIMTDFEIFDNMRNQRCPQYEALRLKYGQVQFTNSGLFGVAKSLLNWVEDRRIDNYIFTTSPGYKAYYHKLYDHYWNSKNVTKGFLAAEFSNPTNLDNYLFHIVNMMNPNFNIKAMPGLDKIVQIIDLPNISRIKNTDEALTTTCDILDILIQEGIDFQKKEEENKTNPGEGEGEGGTGDGETTETEDGEGKDGGGGGGEDEGTGGGLELSDALTPAEINAIQKAFAEQKNFLNGDTNKKSTTKKLQQQLDAIANQTIDVQTVGDKSIGVRTALLYDYVKSNQIQALVELNAQIDEVNERMRNMSSSSVPYNELWNKYDALRDEKKKLDTLHMFGGSRDEYTDAVRLGTEMGGLLGKKLQLHNESRERVDTRLRSGKIDGKRLAHAGYGIENVFKQISVDRYKKANIHISLDGSGSMSGTKWSSTIQMATAIAKAVSYTQNINVQISIRVTTHGGSGDTPATLSVYDSRVNKFNHLVAVFNSFNPTSMTPEGLCFEAMIAKNMLVPSSSEMDSYFLNISDGEPGCSSYGGNSAELHTKRQVDKMRNELNIAVLSFFIQGGGSSVETEDEKLAAYAKLVTSFMSSGSGRAFRNMYGKDASVVDCNSAIQIAKELNKKFLKK